MMFATPKDPSDHAIGQLTHLGFRRFAPAPALQPWVQCYWIVQQTQLPATGISEKLYPDGGTSLSFPLPGDFSPDFSGNFNNRQTISQMHFSGSVHRFGIRFHPGGAFQLLGLDMSETLNQEIALYSIDPQLQLLNEQLAQARGIAERIALVNRYLLTAAKRNAARQGFIQQLLPALISADITVTHLSEQAALSRRQLERRFQQEVGLSPSQLKLLSRIKRARQLISHAPESALTQIALDAGFYDQAHFIRQFRQITGQTPGQYRQRKMSQKYNARPN